MNVRSATGARVKSMTTRTDSPDERIRIEFSRALTLRRWPVAKGETWDTWRHRIQDDGSIDVDGSIVLPGMWAEVATWRDDKPAPPHTSAQVRANASLHSKDGGK